MAQSAAEARQKVVEARQGVGKELDDLTTAAKAAVDIPAKVRRNPGKTAAVAGGAAFLLLGGPKRVARRAERRFFPKRAARIPTVLPKPIEDSLWNLEPAQQEQVRGHLERDFATYLAKEHPREPANARQSIWKTYDLLIGIVGAAAARELVKKLFEVPQEVEIEQNLDAAEAQAAAQQVVTNAKADARAVSKDVEKAAKDVEKAARDAQAQANAAAKGKG